MKAFYVHKAIVNNRKWTYHIPNHTLTSEACKTTSIILIRCN